MHCVATLGRLFCVNRARSGLAVAATGWTKVAKAGGSGGVFVVAGASWWLWEADSFPKSVTHTLNVLCGDTGAFILRESSTIWPRSGSNRVDEGGKTVRRQSVGCQ
jgi:hypothetical protein